MTFRAMLITFLVVLTLTIAARVFGYELTYDSTKKINEVKINNTELWACHVPERSAKVVSGPFPGSIRGQIVVGYGFSRDYKTHDMTLIYGRKGNQQNPFPTYYVYDIDRDGRPDKAYEDTQGNGICQQMHEVPVDSLVEMPRKGATPPVKPTEPPAMDEGDCHMEEKDPNNPEKEA